MRAAGTVRRRTGREKQEFSIMDETQLYGILELASGVCGTLHLNGDGILRMKVALHFVEIRGICYYLVQTIWLERFALY